MFNKNPKKHILLIADKVLLMYTLLILEKNNLMFHFPRKNEISILR